MKTAAIIAEYNPFHRGHEYHIAQTRRQTGASHIVAIMSGSFVQRGDCAVFSKFARARAAVMCGADLVIELPVSHVLASAERFAQGGVSLAGALGCIDLLSFGSESGDIAILEQTANLLHEQREEIGRLTRENMKSSGATYAAARSAALAQLGHNVLGSDCPNDTLALEYLRAILQYSLPLKAHAVKREGSAHDSMEDGRNGICSATFLRQKIREEGSWQQYVSGQCAPIYEEAVFQQNAPADISRLESAILARLRTMSAEDIALLPDVSEGLENRIYSASRTAKTLDELFFCIKCKRYTLARIRRIILSALLGIKADYSLSSPPYIRLLAMNERGREILRAAKPTLPIVAKSSDLAACDAYAQEIFALECRATDLWAMCCPEIAPCGLDLTTRLTTL